MLGRMMMVTTLVLLAGCGGGDDDADNPDGSVPSVDAAVNRDAPPPPDGFGPGADGATSASPCSPSIIAPADDPTVAGDKFTNVTYDPGSGDCALTNTEMPVNHVMSVLIWTGMPGACPARPDWSLDSSSHGSMGGIGCFGPLPSNTDITIRASNSNLGITLDITWRHNTGDGSVQITALSLVTGS